MYSRVFSLFETEREGDAQQVPPLSLKVYMWADVRDGTRDPGEVSSVVGLQRVLVLEAAESSPVAFLITLLRLLALHAHRLKQLGELCREVGDKNRREGARRRAGRPHRCGEARGPRAQSTRCSQAVPGQRWGLLTSSSGGVRRT